MDQIFDLTIEEFIKSALSEDVGDGDHTTLACIDSNKKGKAIVKAKEAGVIAGVIVAQKILLFVNSSLIAETFVKDGDLVRVNQEIMRIEGNIQSMLKAERLLLNCMQRMSGIATKTKNLVNIIEDTTSKILDTRKTTPNFRFFEKWAVRIGGGYNHRIGLYDMILIKDNHIDSCGGITNAIRKANAYLEKGKKNLKIEIETRTLEEVNEVLRCGQVNRIMLDNFLVESLKEAVRLINRRFETEASGGITDKNIRSVAETGVDFISVGALTHSYKSLDINLKIHSKE